MGLLQKWNPRADMAELQRRIGTLLGLSNPIPPQVELDFTAKYWALLLEITEDDKEYLVKAELPEVKEADVKVSVENGMFHLSGERKRPREENGRKLHRVELSYGRFEHSFALPNDADPNQVTTRFKDGLLQVHLAKKEITKPKSREIKIS